MTFMHVYENRRVVRYIIFIVVFINFNLSISYAWNMANIRITAMGLIENIYTLFNTPKRQFELSKCLNKI